MDISWFTTDKVAVIIAFLAIVVSQYTAFVINKLSIAAQREQQRFVDLRILLVQFIDTAIGHFKGLRDIKSKVDPAEVYRQAVTLGVILREIEMVLINDSKCKLCANLKIKLRAIEEKVRHMAVKVNTTNANDALSLVDENNEIASLSNDCFRIGVSILDKYLYNKYSGNIIIKKAKNFFSNR